MRITKEVKFIVCIFSEINDKKETSGPIRPILKSSWNRGITINKKILHSNPPMRGSIQIFKFALKEIAELEKMTGIKIKIETEKGILKCRVCGYRWNYSDSIEELKGDEEKAEFIHFVPEVAHVYLRCPHCKSPDFEITKGRGVGISSIKGLR